MLDLVHHIPEAAISDWYAKEPSWCLRAVGLGCQKVVWLELDRPDQFRHPCSFKYDN